MTPHRTHSQAAARLQLLGSVVLFGLMAALARLASSRAGGFSAGQMSLVRFGVGGVLVAALMGARRGTFRPVNLRLLAVRGGAGGLAALAYFAALSLIPAGRATLLNTLYPVLAVPLAALVLRERPTVHLALALALTAAGVFLVLGGGSATFQLGVGDAVGLASGLLGAVGTEPAALAETLERAERLLGDVRAAAPTGSETTESAGASAPRAERPPPPAPPASRSGPRREA